MGGMVVTAMFWLHLIGQFIAFGCFIAGVITLFIQPTGGLLLIGASVVIGFLSNSVTALIAFNTPMSATPPAASPPASPTPASMSPPPASPPALTRDTIGSAKDIESADIEKMDWIAYYSYASTPKAVILLLNFFLALTIRLEAME